MILFICFFVILVKDFLFLSSLFKLFILKRLLCDHLVLNFIFKSSCIHWLTWLISLSSVWSKGPDSRSPANSILRKFGDLAPGLSISFCIHCGVFIWFFLSGLICFKSRGLKVLLQVSELYYILSYVLFTFMARATDDGWYCQKPIGLVLPSGLWCS